MNRIYISPFTNTLVKLKQFSLGTCATSLIACPFLLTLSTNPSINPSAKYIAFGAVLATGIGSTGFLKWFLNPYVTSISMSGRSLKDLKDIKREDLRKQSIGMETMDMFGRSVEFTGKIEDFGVADTWRPMVTWHHKPTGRLFYVHEEILMNSPEGEKFVKEMSR